MIWTLAIILLVVAVIGLPLGLVLLLPQRTRRLGKRIAAGAAIAFVVMIPLIVIDADRQAQLTGFESASDKRAAEAAGVSDPTAWKIERERLAKLEIERRSEVQRALEQTQREAADRKAKEVDFHTPPSTQKRFIETVVAARQAYKAGATDLVKGGTRVQRMNRICGILNDHRVSNWVGRVLSLSSNNTGLGVLEIDIGDNVTLKTWNNSISDFAHHTLIDPDSSLFKKLTTLRKETRVRLSGTFFRSDVDCVQETSLTQHGTMTAPAFLFRFSRVDTFS